MRNPSESAAGRIEEEKIYESIAHEIAEGSVRAGLWTKAVSQAEGNVPQIESIYIKLRFENILDEMALKEEEERRKAEKLAEEERRKTELLIERLNKTSPIDRAFYFIFFGVLGVLIVLLLFVGLVG